MRYWITLCLIISLVLLGFFVKTSAADTCTTLFQPPVAYALGGGPSYRVRGGDFNGDGKLDIVVTNANTQNVSILLGNGDGTFQPHVEYPVGVAYEVAIGDFNGDGRLDLAVTNERIPDWGSEGSISLLLGNGDGTFQPRVDYDVGFSQRTITTGDFNGDGKLDIATVIQLGFGSIGILIGNGDGTFAPPVHYVSVDATHSIVVGDFDRDGKLDIVVSANSGVRLLPGNGDGTFATAVLVAEQYNTETIIAADFNRDGKLDLATSTHVASPPGSPVYNPTGHVSILLGNGNGTFQGRQDYEPGTNSTAQFNISTADFNGDGNLDLVARTQKDAPTHKILFGNGDGTFQAGIALDPGVGGDAFAGDFNSDGKTDLAMLSEVTAVKVLLGGCPSTCEAELAAAEQQIQNLQNQVDTLNQQNAQLQDQLTAANQTIQNQLDRVKAGLRSIQMDFRTVFRNPNFTIPGNTPLKRYENLVNAILGLNRASKNQLYRNLGGTP